MADPDTPPAVATPEPVTRAEGSNGVSEPDETPEGNERQLDESPPTTLRRSRHPPQRFGEPMPYHLVVSRFEEGRM